MGGLWEVYVNSKKAAAGVKPHSDLGRRGMARQKIEFSHTEIYWAVDTDSGGVRRETSTKKIYRATALYFTSR